MKTKHKQTENPEHPVARMEQPVIEMPANPDDGEMVVRLLRRFGAQQAGDSQEEAATRLASMALILSNIAAAHRVVRVDNNEADMGVGFAVEGGLLAADFAMSVMEPALRLQERWERNLLHDVEAESTFFKGKRQPSKEELQQRSLDKCLLPLPRARTLFKVARRQLLEAATPSRPGPPSNPSVGSSAPSAMPDAAPLHSQDKSPDEDAEWAETVRQIPEGYIGFMLIEFRRQTCYREMLDFPVCVTEVSGIRDLDARATRAHLGRVLAYARIDTAEKLEAAGTSLVESACRRTVLWKGGARTVRIDPVLCVGSGVIDQAIASGRVRPGMFKQTLWLVESTIGGELPELPESTEESNSKARNYPTAFENELRKRMHFKDEKTHDLPALDGKLAEWRNFLRERERHFPGIALAAGNLPHALCYGLESLGGNRMAVDGDEVIAFAKWLVLRMVNRLAEASGSHDSIDLESLAEEILRKFTQHGPMTVRDLVRKFSRLPTSKCQEALLLLEARNIAAKDQNVWGILADCSSAKVFLTR